MMRPSGGDEPGARDLERLLEGVRFRPRPSLGAEIVGRFRRGEQSKGAAGPRRSRSASFAVAAAAAIAAAVWLGGGPRDVTADQCCFDLDGGRDADDGLVVVARGGERVRRISLYEDRDGSKSYSAGDVLRFVRGAEPTMDPSAVGQLVTTRHCCSDFDGGGPEDDGLVIVGVPPDHVMMVALYEEPRGAKPSRYLLR